MTWEKDGKSYRYEGEFYDRQFHGEGKLYENDNLIHNGRFERVNRSLTRNNRYMTYKSYKLMMDYAF